MIERILKSFAIFSLLSFFLAFFYIPIEFEDIWWHLATGRWILEHFSVPHQDMFSFTGQGGPWVFTQWLGSTIYYVVYHLWAEDGLKAFRVSLFLSIVLLFFVYSYRKVPFSLLLLLIFVMLFGLRTRCLLRPFVFNMIFIQLFLIILFAYQKNKNQKVLYLLPILGALWGNLHLGSFVYGVLLIGTFLGSAIVKYFGLKLEKNSRDLDAPLKQVKELGLTLLAFLLSLFVSPYGLDAGLYPFKVFLIPQHINFYKLNYVMSEMQSPGYIFSLSGFWFFFLFIGAVSALIWSKEKNTSHVMLLVIATFMFLFSRRGADSFALISAYIIVENTANRSFKDIWGKLKYSKIYNSVIYIVLIAFSSVLFMNQFNQKIYAHGQFTRRSFIKCIPDNPLSSIEFLKKNKMTGLVFNSNMFGGYMMLSCFPQLLPFSDGRQLNQEIFAKYILIKNDPEQYWPIAMNEYGFKIVLFEVAVSPGKMIQYIGKQPDWQLVFIDGDCVIFVKRGEFDLSEEAQELEQKLKAVKYSKQEINQLKDLLARPEHKGFSQFLNSPPDYIDILEEGATLFDLGFKGEGLKRIIKAFEVSDQPLTRQAAQAALKALEKEN